MAKKMLKSHHLAILALVLALGIATPIVVASLSEDEAARAADETDSEGGTTTPDDTVTEAPETPTTDNTSVTVGTFEDLKSALEDDTKSTIILSDNIELPESLTISRDLTLDLATYKVTVADGVKIAFEIRQGDVEITGAEGSEISVGAGVTLCIYGSKVSTDTDFTHLTVTKGVTITASETDNASYGIAINRFDGNNNVAYGAKVDFNGDIKAYNGITTLGYLKHSDNAPIINIGDDATITATNADGGMALYAAGYGVWNVGAASLTGSSALGTKAGEFTFTGTNMTANGTHHDDVAAATGSIAGSGATFQIEDNADYAGGVQITIDGGQYSSENSNVFYEYSSAARANSGPLQKLIIKSGTFNAGADGAIFSGVNSEAVNITGGSYNKEFAAEYLGTNQKLVENNGSWTIQATSVNPPSTNPDPDDENGDTEQQPDDKPSDKPQAKPDKDAPETGVHNITNYISAIATTTTAVITGVLVFFAVLLRQLIRRRSGKSENPAAKTSREVENSRTKVAAKPAVKSSAKSPAKSTHAKSTATKSVKAAKTTKSAKSPKSSAKPRSKPAKTSTKKGTKTTKARK